MKVSLQSPTRLQVDVQSLTGDVVRLVTLAIVPGSRNSETMMRERIPGLGMKNALPTSNHANSPETLVLYRKRASTKEAYLNTVVRRAFDKAV